MMSTGTPSSAGLAAASGNSKVKTLGRTGVWLSAALLISACGRIGLNDPLASYSPPPPNYAPLPAAPTTPVTSSALPPPPTTSAPSVAAGTPIDPAQPPQPAAGTAAGIPIASATPPKPAEPVANDKSTGIGRGEFVGAWRISSGSDNCQLFVSLTSWSGGYRASTKGCNSSELQRISAWDLSGKQIALKSGDGGVIVLLSNAGQEKFAGSTAAKQTISLSR